MHIKTAGTCRGDGKIYIRLRVINAAEDASLSISAKGRHDEQIPCNIYRSLSVGRHADEAYYVAVFPILRIEAESFTIYDRNNPSSSQTLPLNFTEAKWASRLNYKINPRLCKEIRGYDKISTYVNTNFEYWECIDDADSCIVRGAIRLPYYKDSSLKIICLDLALKEVTISPIILSDAKAASEVKSDVFLREIQVSIRLPKPLRDVIFVMRDMRHPELDSFNALPLKTISPLIDETSGMMMNAQIDPFYPTWFEDHRVTLDVLAKQTSTYFTYRPRYSIIVPLFNTPKQFFDDMLRSVTTQSYGKWELVLVNASPENQALSELAHQAANSDNRIKLVTLTENKGISENTNAGLDVAHGDFICFFDHDDTLEPNLLFEYTNAINKFDDVDVLYCDEDKLMPDGKLAQPYFKPDFNPDLLMCNNYICHMLTIRKDLLDMLPRNTADYDGAQDHNLTLRAVEKARRVHHVAKVLYHWRISDTSTAANADNKPYASKAGIRAVQEHLDRLGIKASVSLSRRPFTYRVRYDIPTPHPLVSIIIPTKDHVDVLDTCLQSIFDKSTYDNYEIVLVENNSVEHETFAYYRQLAEQHPSKVRLISWEGEFNFSKLMNFGAQSARGDYFLLLNNDTEVITPAWIEELLGICMREDVGAVGCRLYYRDDTIQHAGICVTGGAAGHLNKNLPHGQWGYFALADATQDLSAVTAACMITKRSAFNAVGGFTEKLAVAFNDVDYCLKLREKGLLVVYTPEAELYHYESLSRGYETSVEKKVRFHREVSYMNYRWAEYYIKGDPYINVNITRNEPFNCYYHL